MLLSALLVTYQAYEQCDSFRFRLRFQVFVNLSQIDGPRSQVSAACNQQNGQKEVEQQSLQMWQKNTYLLLSQYFKGSPGLLQQIDVKLLEIVSKFQSSL